MIKKLKETAPRIDFIIQNYHYEERPSRNGNYGITERNIVYTHKAT